MNQDEDLSAVAEALKTANEHGLQAEVMWSAMREYEKFHRHAPETYNMKWALDCALNDWDI
tara:strand:- start:1110 stop:1292 length:183 start_codon:yes stop_codon:yes gene_type:complete